MKRAFRGWRYWSIRSRMAITTVGLCACALAVAVVSATAILESVLTDRIDDQLNAAAKMAEDTDMNRTGPPPDPPGPRTQVPDVPDVLVYSDDGELVDYMGGRDRALELPVVAELDDLVGQTVTLEDRDGHGWRVMVRDGPDSGYLVFALSVEYVEAATDNLLLIGGAVSLGILVLLAIVAMWVVGIGLRPLSRMEITAQRIADGALEARVPDADPHTETGRLGQVLNTMLARLQTAFDDRAASEDRLRQFLADASHELRTPLTSITGFAQLYRRGGAPPGPVLDETVGRIEAESQRMRLLLDDLMLLATLDEHRPVHREHVDLLGVCAEVIGDAHLRAPDRFVSLEGLDDSEELLDAVGIVGDEARLRQVITNLVTNALRHTPSDASITVRLGWSHSLGPPCLTQVGAAPRMPAAVVEVLDSGPGVPAEHASAVFERLYRADASRARDPGFKDGGTGLGLAIVAAIVTSHGGCVRLSDTPGGGATFRVVLPARPIDGESRDDGFSSRRS